MRPEPATEGWLGPRFAAPLAVASGVFALDQITKLLVRTHLGLRESIPVSGHFYEYFFCKLFFDDANFSEFSGHFFVFGFAGSRNAGKNV